MVVTQRNPPNHASTRKHNAKSPNVRPTSKKSQQTKQKDTFKFNTDEINSTGDFVHGTYVESSPSSPVSYQPPQQTSFNVSPIRPTTSLHTNSTPLVNNMGPRPNLNQPLYYTPAPVHYRNYSTPAIYPITAPPSVPIPTSLAKPIPFALKEEPNLLAPAKLSKQSTPSLPIPISATKPGYFSVDELEQPNNSPTKKSESFELGTSPGSSPPVSSSAPKRLQNAAVKPANSRYYSDGNYANAPHPSDLPRPQFS